MTALTPAERAAIAAYTGPVTVLTPQPCGTKGMYWVNNKPFWEDQFKNRNTRQSRLAQATCNDVRKLMNEGMALPDIATRLGMSMTSVRDYMRKVTKEDAE